jgi:hypothetical protein
MEAALKPYQGQNVGVIVSKLGYPNDERPMLGHSIYTWRSGNPYYGGFCDLNVVVGKDERIVSASWNGNIAGCANFTSRLGS